MLAAAAAAAVLVLLAAPTSAGAAPGSGDGEDGGDLGLAAGIDLLEPATPPRTAPPPPPRWQWEGGLAMTMGGTSIDSHVGAEGGMVFEAGLRFDRTALIASYGLLGLSDGSCTAGRSTCDKIYPAPPGDGLEQRLGLDLRLTVLRGHLMMKARRERVAHPTATELYVEGGLGHEAIDWAHTHLDRDDVGFGLGVALPTTSAGAHAIGHVGVRVVLARDEQMGRLDPTVMLTVGVSVGN